MEPLGLLFSVRSFFIKKKMPAYCYEENLANIKHAKQQKKKKKKKETKKLIIHSHCIVIVNVISLALA